jgi:hypothetical protein
VDRVHGRCEPAVQSGPWWTTSGADKERGGASPARSARAHRSSPKVAVGDEAVLEGCSSEDERWQRGGLTMAKSDDSSSSS